MNREKSAFSSSKVYNPLEKAKICLRLAEFLRSNPIQAVLGLETC
jgi:hypothetical protein